MLLKQKLIHEKNYYNDYSEDFYWKEYSLFNKEDIPKVGTYVNNDLSEMSYEFNFDTPYLVLENKKDELCHNRPAPGSWDISENEYYKGEYERINITAQYCIAPDSEYYDKDAEPIINKSIIAYEETNWLDKSIEEDYEEELE